MSRSPAQQHVRFSISGLSAWAPGVTTAAEWQEWYSGNRNIAPTGEPALQQMPPLLRRHAGRLGRFACSVAYDALATATDTPMVFSSRYGEVSRSVDLLTALAANEELSPASFGLSVHNAIAGLFSMARKDTANSISLAAGDASAEYGVVEACSLLADGVPAVLLVVADVPLPDIYATFADTTPDAFAWGCILTQPDVCTHELSWSAGAPTAEQRAEPTASAPCTAPGALRVLPVLLGHEPHVTRDAGGQRWSWQRND